MWRLPYLAVTRHVGYGTPLIGRHATFTGATAYNVTCWCCRGRTRRGGWVGPLLSLVQNSCGVRVPCPGHVRSWGLWPGSLALLSVSFANHNSDGLAAALLPWQNGREKKGSFSVCTSQPGVSGGLLSLLTSTFQSLASLACSPPHPAAAIY